MKVLFTNLQLDHRTGTEIVIRDLATGMHKRGHEITVYTPHPGPIAEELIERGIAVVDRIEKVPFVPDIIHGHHHSPTIEALTRFDNTPAIWVCHGRFFYQDIPPLHPAITRYVAVDLSCRERIVSEAGIPESQVRLIHNSVDLARFRRRSDLPHTIGRAVVFSNGASRGGFVDAIAEACRQRGITLDVIGDTAGKGDDAPERSLGQYDVVFAKARCALEALATGCAVVLIDHPGIGPMVTSTNMALLRDWNFGARCLQGFPTPERVLGELQRFDPIDAARVTDWVRSEAGLELCLDEFLGLYEEVVREGPVARLSTGLSPVERTLDYAAMLEQRLRLLQEPVVSMPLPPTISSEIRLGLVGAPCRVRPAKTFGINVTVSNHSGETLASVAPYPVCLAYHWVCPADRTADIFDGVRTLLGRPLHPGTVSTLRLAVEAPTDPGSYVLCVTLVQESVFWFDELTPPVECRITIEVDGLPTDDAAGPTMTLAGVITGLPAALACGLRLVSDGVFSDLGFVGDSGHRILTFAGSPGFVRRAIANASVTCVITTQELADMVPSSIGVMVAADPKVGFFRLHNWIASSTGFYADDSPTSLAPSAVVHPTAAIDPFSVRIGDDCVIGANVVIHGPAVVGPRTKVDAGAVIGASGFQTSGRSGSYVELQHVGGVKIGEDSHIYSNTTIARGQFRASTEIGDRCQIGNNAFVSHQCRLGDNVFVGHNATVNGRASIADDVWIGPGAIISNEVKIGAGARVALGSTVMHDVPANGRVSGLPALDQRIIFRHAASIRTKRH